MRIGEYRRPIIVLYGPHEAALAGLPWPLPSPEDQVGWSIGYVAAVLCDVDGDCPAAETGSCLE